MVDDARLEALLLEGLASKRLRLDDAFWQRMEAKTEAILDKHATQGAVRLSFKKRQKASGEKHDRGLDPVRVK